MFVGIRVSSEFTVVSPIFLSHALQHEHEAPDECDACNESTRRMFLLSFSSFKVCFVTSWHFPGLSTSLRSPVCHGQGSVKEQRRMFWKTSRLMDVLKIPMVLLSILLQK